MHPRIPSSNAACRTRWYKTVDVHGQQLLLLPDLNWIALHGVNMRNEVLPLTMQWVALRQKAKMVGLDQVERFHLEVC